MNFMFKIQISIMNKIFLISILLLIVAFLIFYYNLSGITGFAGADLNVSIKLKTRGKILLEFNPLINLTESQNIRVEFINTGTTNYTARIEITVFMYNTTTGTLDELANYYDTSVYLYPGGRKSFSTVFLPTREGTYYIKVRVPYDARIAEYWGSFYVSFQYILRRRIVFSTYGGQAIPTKGVGITDLELRYKDKIDLYPGQKILLGITVNNTGTTNLHNLKFYSSITDYVYFEVNPKEVYELGPREYKIFLVSLETSKDTPPGEYDFFFEVVGLEIKEIGNVKLNITYLAELPPKDEIYETILNYEYLITELDYEIYLTSLKGFNTSRAEKYLNDARRNLQKAREYFDQENYEDAKDVLDIVKKDLEDVVFELAAISFIVFVYPAFAPFLILILLIMIVIGTILFIYLYKRGKKKKPKIIREFTEEET